MNCIVVVSLREAARRACSASCQDSTRTERQAREKLLTARRLELEFVVIDAALGALEEIVDSGDRHGLPCGSNWQCAGGHEVGLDLDFRAVGEREAGVTSEWNRRLAEAFLRQVRLRWTQPVLVAAAVVLHGAAHSAGGV